MVCFGVSNTLFSLGLGKLVDIAGPGLVIVMGACAQIAVALFLIFFWNIVLSSLNTHWFEHNSRAAFANFKFWQSMGGTVAFLISTRLSFHYRLWINIIAIGLGVICFLVARSLRASYL